MKNKAQFLNDRLCNNLSILKFPKPESKTSQALADIILDIQNFVIINSAYSYLVLNKLDDIIAHVVKDKSDPIILALLRICYKEGAVAEFNKVYAHVSNKNQPEIQLLKYKIDFIAGKLVIDLESGFNFSGIKQAIYKQYNGQVIDDQNIEQFYQFLAKNKIIHIVNNSLHENLESIYKELQADKSVAELKTLAKTRFSPFLVQFEILAKYKYYLPVIEKLANDIKKYYEYFDIKDDPYVNYSLALISYKKGNFVDANKIINATASSTRDVELQKKFSLLSHKIQYKSGKISKSELSATDLHLKNWLKKKELTTTGRVFLETPTTISEIICSRVYSNIVTDTKILVKIFDEIYQKSNAHNKHLLELLAISILNEEQNQSKLENPFKIYLVSKNDMKDGMFGKGDFSGFFKHGKNQLVISIDSLLTENNYMYDFKMRAGLRTFMHEIGHYVLNEIYLNNADPFRAGDKIGSEFYSKVLGETIVKIKEYLSEKYAFTSDLKDKTELAKAMYDFLVSKSFSQKSAEEIDILTTILSVYKLYENEAEAREVIVRIPQNYDVQGLNSKYPFLSELADYYENVVGSEFLNSVSKNHNIKKYVLKQQEVKLDAKVDFVSILSQEADLEKYLKKNAEEIKKLDKVTLYRLYKFAAEHNKKSKLYTIGYLDYAYDLFNNLEDSMQIEKLYNEIVESGRVFTNINVLERFANIITKHTEKRDNPELAKKVAGQVRKFYLEARIDGKDVVDFRGAFVKRFGNENLPWVVDQEPIVIDRVSDEDRARFLRKRRKKRYKELEDTEEVRNSESELIALPTEEVAQKNSLYLPILIGLLIFSAALLVIGGGIFAAALFLPVIFVSIGIAAALWTATVVVAAGAVGAVASGVVLAVEAHVSNPICKQPFDKEKSL